MAEVSAAHDRAWISLLGGISATVDGRHVDIGGPKQRAVLALLALDAGRVVSADRLIEGLWRDRPPEQAPVSLRSYTSNLRRILGVPIENRRPGYVLVTDPLDVDVHRFEHLVSRAQEELRTGNATDAAATLREALALWAGPPLRDVADGLDVADVVVRLEERHAEAVESLAEARLSLGDDNDLVADLTAAVAEHPYREGLRALLARALYQAGRQVEALRSIDEARQVLRDEIGVDPGPALRALEAAILEHDPSLGPSPGSASESIGRAVVAPSRGLFVGRNVELDVLVDATRSTLAGGPGRAFVLSGEPGIGKTRLVEELSARAATAGATVVWARCPEGASSAYWPWLQIADQLDHASGTALRAALAPVESGSIDAQSEQFAVRANAVKALAGIDRPALVVIDDLQWADEASLRLLEFAAAELRRLPVVIAITTRPVEPDSPATLLDCLGELARTADVVRLALTGLSPAAVSDWLQGATGAAPDPGVTAFVHDRTAGNPFFVRELAALLGSEGRLSTLEAVRAGSTVPAGVQDVVRRRASRLPPDTQRLVVAASVVGHRFDIDVLAAVTELSVERALDVLAPALDAGLIDADSDRLGRFAFSHALVAETLAAEQNAIRRARVHAAATRALESLRGPDLDPVMADLARHAVEGASAGTAPAGVEYSVRAADLATRARAHGNAAAHLANAVRALELAAPGDRARRQQLLHAQGLAYVAAGDVRGAHVSLFDAAELADSLGDFDATAAALTRVNSDDLWASQDWSQFDPRAIALIERTVAALPPGDSADRANLLAALSAQEYYADGEAAMAHSTEAVDIARRIGDPFVLARVLVQRFWAIWRPSTNTERTRTADELLALVQHVDLPVRFTAIAHLARFTCAYEIGDTTVAEKHLTLGRAEVDPSRTPEMRAQLLWSEASMSLLRGDFDAAERQAEDMYAAFQTTRSFVAEVCRIALLGQLETERGHGDAALHLMTAAENSPYAGSMSWYAAWALSEVGAREDATRMLQAFDGDLPDDWYATFVRVAGLHAAVAIDDRQRIAAIADALAPVSGFLACNGSGGPVLGPVDLALAAAAHALGAVDRARALLASALDMVERLRADPWVARCLALRAQLDGDDADRSAALTIAERLGMPSLAARLRP
ncbi:MAG TPA: BTAD domain-containing putative transcriptional regulator [Acidimicrobiales bacterium]|nr:BTAD domain-containing putative transcriptional regulator [Acidimicrobiales bacterium]